MKLVSISPVSVCKPDVADKFRLPVSIPESADHCRPLGNSFFLLDFFFSLSGADLDCLL